MKYGIVYCEDAEEFVELVNKSLKEGWSVAGGVSVTKVGPGFRFTQAMTMQPKETVRDRSGDR